MYFITIDPDDRDLTFDFNFRTYFAIISLYSSVTFYEFRKSGILNRTFLAGVSFSEILFGKMIAGLVIVMLNIFISTLTALFIVESHHNGGFILFTIFMSLSMLIGLIAGYIFGIICNDANNLMGINRVMFNMQFTVGNLIWPLESIRIPLLKAISCLLPSTFPGIAAKNFLIKGLVWNKNSFYGIAVISGWIVACITVLMLLTWKRKMLN
jgi:ABC-type multidrug transport system permease subunit